MDQSGGPSPSAQPRRKIAAPFSHLSNGLLRRQIGAYGTQRHSCGIAATPQEVLPMYLVFSGFNGCRLGKRASAMPRRTSSRARSSSASSRKTWPARATRTRRLTTLAPLSRKCQRRSRLVAQRGGVSQWRINGVFRRSCWHPTLSLPILSWTAAQCRHLESAQRQDVDGHSPRIRPPCTGL